MFDVTLDEMIPPPRPGAAGGRTRPIVSPGAVGGVIRGIFTKRMMPALHPSTFEVGSRLRESSIEVHPVLAGFLEQVQAVSVGLTQPIRDAVVDCTDIIVEGPHVVPGFLDLPALEEAVVAASCIRRTAA